MSTNNMNMKHTPTPWRVVEREVLEDGSVYPAHIVGGSRDLEICQTESSYNANSESQNDGMMEVPGDIRSKRANAAHIVHCVNNHDALVAALWRYGDHYPECTVIQECGNAVKPPCNCGYDAALLSVRKSEVTK